MALNRTWYNALVDDDGSNTVGTVWGKDDIKNLLDSVDAEITRIGALHYCDINLVNANGQAFPNAVFTVATFDSFSYNPYGMWSGSDPTAILIPVAGTYHITAQIFWDNNQAGLRVVQVLGNGVAILPDALQNAVIGGYTGQQVTGISNLAAGVRVQVQGYQSAGGSLRAGGYGGFSTNRLRVDRISG